MLPRLPTHFSMSKQFDSTVHQLGGRSSWVPYIRPVPLRTYVSDFARLRVPGPAIVSKPNPSHREEEGSGYVPTFNYTWVIGDQL